MNLAKLTIIAVGILVLSGCVSDPVLELYGARINSASPTGIQLTMQMKVTNNNSFDVKVRNVRVNVTVAQQYQLPYLQYNPDQWLAANQATILNVPMVIPWGLVAPLASASLGSNAVHYHILGYADVTAVRLLNIQKNDYTLDQDGVFSRVDLVMAAGRGLLSQNDPKHEFAPRELLGDIAMQELPTADTAAPWGDALDAPWIQSAPHAAN